MHLCLPCPALPCPAFSLPACQPARLVRPSASSFPLCPAFPNAAGRFCRLRGRPAIRLAAAAARINPPSFLQYPQLADFLGIDRLSAGFGLYFVVGAGGSSFRLMVEYDGEIYSIPFCDADRWPCSPASRPSLTACLPCHSPGCLPAFLHVWMPCCIPGHLLGCLAAWLAALAHACVATPSLLALPPPQRLPHRPGLPAVCVRRQAAARRALHPQLPVPEQQVRHRRGASVLRGVHRKQS